MSDLLRWLSGALPCSIMRESGTDDGLGLEDTQCLGGVAIGDWSLGSTRALVVQQVLDHITCIELVAIKLACMRRRRS